MKIYAPVKDANGVYASVRFVNGVGETDNPRLIKWFKDQGYAVENEKAKNQRVEMLPTTHESEPEMLDNGDQPDFDAMTSDELRNWARSNGYGSKIKNTRNKEKLLEILRG